MARLNNDDWLAHAKRVPVGEQRRIRHGRESRDNLIVGNKDDRWWAYCQACKCGAVEQKTHVLLVDREPEKSRDLSLPRDMRPIGQLAGFEQQALARFLGSKHMDLLYLPKETAWSAERQRLMVPTAREREVSSCGRGIEWRVTEWMGRDTSGKSPQKWLTYNGQHYVGDVYRAADLALLVEDAFSYFKVRHALQHNKLRIAVYCTLGTAIHDTLFLELLQNHTHVASFYDGDIPGWHGATRNEVRLSGAGIGHRAPIDAMCAPDGKDPKDMELQEIFTHTLGLLALCT